MENNYNVTDLYDNTTLIMFLVILMDYAMNVKQNSNNIMKILKCLRR